MKCHSVIRLPFALALLFITSATHLHAAAGGLDLSFGNGGKVHTRIGLSSSLATSVAVQADGKIVVAGYSYSYSGVDNFTLVRYTSSGELDSSFGSGGMVVTALTTEHDRATSVAVQVDGKIVVAGSSNIGRLNSNFAVVRYTSSGELDSSFGSGGVVTTDISGYNDYAASMSVQADGTIFVSGSASGKSAMVRYTSSGALDLSFGSGGIITTDITFGGWVGAMLLSDGRILVPAYEIVGTFYGFALYCFTSNGVLDLNFGTFGKVTTNVGSGSCIPSNLAVQADGKIVVGGYTYGNAPPNDDFALARFTSMGILDTGFGINGTVTTDFVGGQDNIRSIVVQADGKILVSGFASIPSLTTDTFALARYTSSGVLDSGFGAGGKITTAISNNDFGSDMVLQSDGKILVTGDSNFTGSQEFSLVRYNVVAPAPVVAVGSITALSSSSATLNGTVNPNFAATTAQFEYGTTAGYGFTASVTLSPNNDSNTQAVSAMPTGLTPGTLYHYRLSAANSGGSSYTSDGTFTALTTSENWRLIYFGSSSGAGSAADDADYDHDGIPNLIEFALNLNPTTSSRLSATTEINGENAEYTYSRSTAAATAGASFTVEWSDTLAVGSWSNGGVTQNLLSDDGTMQQMKAVIPINAAPRKFVRLSVSAPP